MRFYAGAPLRAADGLIIGALCILDSKPRTLEENEVDCLKRWRAMSSHHYNERRGRGSAGKLPVASSATVGQVVPDSLNSVNYGQWREI